MKTREYWEAQAKKVAVPLMSEDLFSSYWTKRYLDNLKYIKSGRRILDIGCGNAKYFVKLDGEFEEFWGVELNPVHFEAAQKIFPKGKYVVADGSQLPFQDGYFDTIISFGAFEHNDDITAIFRECHRVLAENGVLLFSVPNYISPSFPYIYISNRLRKHDRIAAIGYHYSKKFLRTKLHVVGFGKIEVIDTIYAAPIPIVTLGVGLVKGVRAFISGKPRTTKEKIERPAENKLGELRRIGAILDYYFSKTFYPLERFGFGFMRMVYCEKGQGENLRRI
jgi:SAM-dependent methyltransferase